MNPQLKPFIDRVILPALLDRFLAEQRTGSASAAATCAGQTASHVESAASV